MKNIISFKDFSVNEKKKHDPYATVRSRGKCVFKAEDNNVTDDKDHFPINSVSQARNALARAKQYSDVPEWYKGTLIQLQKAVKNAVADEYPSIEIAEDYLKK